MSTIYREYRPQNFEELVGQNHIKTTLKYEIESNNLAHAYLFCGSRGIGKTTVARVFAKSINCKNRKDEESEPCNTCGSCESITLGKNIDIIEMDAASHTGVDNIRENIINASRIPAINLKYKVFIIDEVHMLSVSAFNALLKVLEEPSDNVVFILATTEVHKIPATIVSRCQRFDFKRINITDIIKKLRYVAGEEGVEIEDGILESIARQSEGHMRDAESLFGQIIAIANSTKNGKKISEKDADLVIPRSDINEAITLVELLQKKDAGTAINLINKIIIDGIDLKRFVADLVELMRKIMLAKISTKLAEKFGLDFGEAIELRVSKVIKEMELENIVRIIERFVVASGEIKNNFIIQLPVEIAIIELCKDIEIKQSNKVSQQDNVQPLSVQRTPVSQNEKSVSIKTKPIQAVVNGSEASNGNVNISHDEVMKKWNEVLVGVKKFNHSLVFILQSCQPGEIKNGVLDLKFKYKFHKERVDDESIRNVIHKTLNEIYGGRIVVESSIDETLTVQASGQSNEQQSSLEETVPAEVAKAQKVEENTEDKKDQKQAKGINKDDENEMMNNLLKTFGGKVVG